MSDYGRFSRLLTGWGCVLWLMALGCAHADEMNETSLIGQPFHLAELSEKTLRGELTLQGILPRGEKPADYNLTLLRAEGEWRSVTGAGVRYNQMVHPVRNISLSPSADALTGKIQITVNPDAWIPEDGKKREISVTLDVKLGEADPETGIRVANGRYRGTEMHPENGERKIEGEIVGRYQPFRLPGTWSSGERTAEGQPRFTFDMGKERVNWNHARHAVQELPEVTDLSQYRGMRVQVTTDQPRADADVTLWMREADGSWYYLRSAVPLIDRENGAAIRFEDFAEAEWVAPGSHVDEDYVLDLTRISHIAIGVVNPLGVGEVSFTLTALDLLPRVEAKREPASVVATGKTISINDHNLIPAGIFGGFAGNLPQEYRPGSQRNLYAQSYPRNPWQRWWHFNTPCFEDWPQMMRILRGEVDEHKKLATYLVSRVDEGRYEKGLSRFSFEKHAESRDADISPSILRSFLTDLISVSDLYDATVWAGYELPESVVRDVQRKDLDDVERMKFNRRLIEATFKPLIRPRPEHGPSELFYIECFGERKEPAHLLSRSATWQDEFQHFATRLAENSRDIQKYGEVVFEFWNEPYLHWGRKDRINLKTQYFREDLAKDGGPVTVKIAASFQDRDVIDWDGFVKAISVEKGIGQSIQARLAQTREWRGYTHEAGETPDQRVRRRVANTLNEILADDKLSQQPIWDDLPLDEPVKRLLTSGRAGELSAFDLRTLNRELIAAAIPGVFRDNPAMVEPPVVPHFQWAPDGKGGLHVVDTSDFTYWSGKGNGWIYDQMYGVMASEIKNRNPDITVIAGWGFRWNEDHWAAWDMLYKHTIDRNIEWIDGVHEHHYQGDVTAIPGTYEVLTAYGMTAHNKWLYSYNTETNDLVDAPARGAVAAPEDARRATEYRRMSYNLRDLIYSIYQTPDKARGRTVIHPTHTPNALHVAYGLLRDLRGRLIECESDDPNVWIVASVDGTDPKSMPPGFDGTQKLVVVVFNDHREPREVQVTVQAPSGTRFRDGRIEWTAVDKSDFRIDRPGRDIEAAGRTEMTFTATIQERGAWKVEFPLEGEIVADDQVQRRQFFSADILQRVKRNQPITTTVALDEKVLADADRAWMKLVVESVMEGEASVKIGSHEIILPRAYTADNVNRIQLIPIPIEALDMKASIEFRVNQGNYPGYHVPMTSIILEQRNP